MKMPTTKIFQTYRGLDKGDGLDNVEYDIFIRIIQLLKCMAFINKIIRKELAYLRIGFKACFF